MLRKLDVLPPSLPSPFFNYLFIAFLQSTQDIKRVISKKDLCVYLQQVPSIDGPLELI
jgi:hypothetical protein